MLGATEDSERPGYAELVAAVVERDARIGELEARLVSVQALVVELRAQLGKSSRNSSKPPSWDGYAKPTAKDKKNKRSLRKRSGRKPGGQDGHQGAGLERVEVFDREELHEPEACEGCGGDLEGAERLADGEESRQVFDLPEEIALGVIEHVAVRRCCEACGAITAGRFFEGVFSAGAVRAADPCAGRLPARL